MEVIELPPFDVERSIRTARMWAVGQMIGGVEEEVLADLVWEIDRLRTALANVRPSDFVNGAGINGDDMPHTVVQKLDAAAIRKGSQ